MTIAAPSAWRGQGRPRIRTGQRDYFWTAEETDRLVQLRAERVSLPRIAVILERTTSSVELRWNRVRKQLGLEKVRGLTIGEPAAHFWAGVDMSAGPNECWPWTRKAKANGYGALVFNMGHGWKLYGAHRVAFFLHHGRMQGDGLQVMHACDNKVCCNPNHLSEGTKSQNMRDAYARGRIKARRDRRGENAPTALLTQAQVEAIRRLRLLGAKRADLATLANVSLGAIDNVLSGRSWKCSL